MRGIIDYRTSYFSRALGDECDLGILRVSHERWGGDFHLVRRGQGIAAAGLAVDLGIVAAATAGFGGVGKQSGEGRAGRKRKREGCNNAPCRSGKSGDGALACLPGQSTRKRR